jgi:DMSO/TMAO reductase YedYZ molybdopterin-dependent catalytic subunit
MISSRTASTTEVRDAVGSVTRRTFLDAACRTAASVATMALGPPCELFAQGGLSKDRLIIRSARPQDLETPSHLLTSWITPNELFYVRSHFYTPAIREAEWTLRIDGEVDAPLMLTLDAVRQFASKTIAVTMECAGNGRSFHDPPVAGVQWEKGAVGTARWTGVPLVEVLARAGIKASAKYVWFDGADTGVGTAPDFIRSLPIEKALHPDTLLAYEMNGERLPTPHGFPLRAIVPGWEGAYSMKWLTHITVSDRNHDGAFVQAAYRLPRWPVSPGTLVSAADTVPVTELSVKSIVTEPAADSVIRSGGPLTIAGFAWSGDAQIRRVDLSTDNGRTWSSARLGRDQARYAWRRFEFVWRPMEPGSHVVLSRATDARGRVQPVKAEWNPGGYLWNAIDQVRVNVSPR